MDFTHSLAVSLCVWIAIFINGLVFFRFNPIPYWKVILVISLVISSVSVMIQYLNMISLITILPPLLAIIFFTVLTRIYWVHSLTMIIIGLTISSLLEFVVTYICSKYSLSLTLVKLAKDYSTDAWYFIGLHLLISLYIYLNRWGFTTIKSHQRLPLNDKLLLFIWLFSIGNCMAGIVIAFNQFSIMLGIVLIFFSLFVLYTILNYIKELKDEE